MCKTKKKQAKPPKDILKWSVSQQENRRRKMKKDQKLPAPDPPFDMISSHRSKCPGKSHRRHVF